MFHTLKRFFAINFRDSLPLLGLYLLSILIYTGKAGLIVLMPRYLIDAAMAGDWNFTVKLVLLFAGAEGILFLCDTWLQPAMARTELLVQNRATAKINAKIMSLSYEYLEDPKFLDLKERAIFPIRNQNAVIALLQFARALIQSLVVLVGLIAILSRMSWWLMAGILGLGLFQVAAMMMSNKRMQAFFKELLPINRRFGYYAMSMRDPKNQADIRLFDMNPLFGKKVHHFNLAMSRSIAGFATFIGRILGIQQATAVGQTALSFYMVGKEVLNRTISIGQFSVYMNAALRFGSELSALVTNFGQFLPFIGYLQPYVELMDMKDTVYRGSEKVDRIGEIEFRHVCFTYPRSDKQVLKDINFTFHEGEKLSLVGQNGAGKTTLVKLLAGLYRPTEGDILIDGRSTAEMDMESYRSHMSAIFQDFKFFPMSLGKNLAGEDYTEDLSSEESTVLRKINQALEQVGVLNVVEQLPYGLDTVVGRSYDAKKGRDFSGGQLQKLAIARALYKGGDLIILDEPTSALDPLAEAEVYEQFNDLVGERTALYISHRMSSSRFCDRILVLNEGEIVEEGDHDTLVKIEGGIYRKLFETQAQYYKDW